jgi:tetratricopeptide (TPR) repeat protein
MLNSTRLLLLALPLLAAGCTTEIGTPTIAPMNLEPALSQERQAKLAAIDLKQATPPLPRLDIPPVDPDVHLARTGEKTQYGLTVTPELEGLWRATGNKDWQYWNAQLSKVSETLPDTPEAKFFLQSLRIQTMIHSGRTNEVFPALEIFRDMELEMFGDNAETLSQYGQVYFWLGQPDKAIAYYTQLLADTGDWWVPGAFYGYPTDLATVTRIAKAMIRSYIGMAGAHLMKHDYAKAIHWAQRGLERHQHVIGLTQHPLWGIVVKADAHLYEGEGWLLTFMGAARLGLTGDEEQVEYILDAARAFFKQGEYRFSDLVVESISDYARYDIGLKKQETQVIGALPTAPVATEARLASAIRARPADLVSREDMTLPVPAAHTIALPGEGEVNSFNFRVTPALARVNEAFIAGDYEAALKDLEEAAGTAEGKLERWFVSYSRARTLLAAGRAADAEAMLPETERLEIDFFGTNIGARSLRGEARFWLGDYEAAIRDELQVVESLGDFRAPTLFVFPPQIPQLALMNRSQFRAYMIIANALIFQGEYERALPWAEAAEQLFEEAHYSWQHQLYSAYLKIDRDMFFARGLNLAIIGAARLQEQPDAELPGRMFASARAYLSAMGYEAGIAAVEAVRARALIDAGKPAEAAQAAAAASADAARLGQAGILWQLQALQGEALLAAGQPLEAEKAYRAAQLGIDAVSGALSTDNAKRRFGVGKEEVTQALVDLDLKRNDLAAVFTDLERGRARAFVDMLGQQKIAAAGLDDRLTRIGDLSDAVRRQRAINAAPGMSSSGGVTIVSNLLQERDQLLSEVRGKDSELADAFSVQTVDLSAIRRKLGAHDRLLYALPVTDESLPLRFLDVRKSGVTLHRTDVSAEALETALDPFLTDEPLLHAASQTKSARMISSALGLDSRNRRGVLYIVPSGPLYFVPWGAMDVNRPVVVLPTGGWLLRENRTVRPQHAAVVVGDPKLGLNWEPLPGAREEASAIGGIYNVSPLIGADAQEAALRQRVGKGVGVLHLATHGIFDARDPLSSAILLSNGDGRTKLTASRLFEEPLRAQLVVLSACETGLGHAQAGDDFLGLARSFYLGGADAVMNSLWPVHDKPTRAYMDVFHRKARNGNYAKAWLAARDHLKSKGLPPSVYGAFVLGGAAGA